MLCAPFSGHLSFKAGTISCYLLSLMPEAAKSKIAGQYTETLDFVKIVCKYKLNLCGGVIL
jgi:hypothetical protein